MSEYEAPQRRDRSHQVTVDDVRELMGASTPHFALQIRNRIKQLIADLPSDDLARIKGEREVARLGQLAVNGEERGPLQQGEHLMPSLNQSSLTRSDS